MDAKKDNPQREIKKSYEINTNIFHTVRQLIDILQQLLLDLLFQEVKWGMRNCPVICVEQFIYIMTIRKLFNLLARDIRREKISHN